MNGGHENYPTSVTDAIMGWSEQQHRTHTQPRQFNGTIILVHLIRRVSGLLAITAIDILYNIIHDDDVQCAVFN